jgi:HEAT repeat protein
MYGSIMCLRDSAPGASVAAEVATIVGLLDHEDPRRRVVAAETLASLGAQARGVLEPVVKQSILDPAPRVRYALLAALEQIGWDAGDWTGQYVRLLSHDDEIAVARAAWAIGRIGPPAESAVPSLVDVALDTRKIVDPRWSAVVALERLGADAAVARSALASLLCDPDADMREAAARALGAVSPDDGAVARLVDALDDPDQLVRESAAEGLQAAGLPLAAGAIERLADLLGDPWPAVRRTTARALTALDPSRSWSARDEASTDEQRAGVETRLGELLADVRSDVERRRQIATFEIGKLGPEAASAVPLLADLYGVADNLDIRWSAAWAFGKMEERALAAVPALLRGLEHDLDPDVRGQTAWALGRIDSTPSVWSALIADGLTRAISDRDSLVREEAVLALGRILAVREPIARDPVQLGAVGGRLADPHPLVRRRAQQALAALAA